jgi:hypothetical protein
MTDHCDHRVNAYALKDTDLCSEEQTGTVIMFLIVLCTYPLISLCSDMNEEPDNLVLSRLLIGFRSEVYELLVTSWCECVHQGFEPVRG